MIPGRRTGALPTLDDALLRELYSDHAGALLAYVRRLLGGDLAKSEDIVQETLLRAWQHPDALLEGRTRGWLCTVARNLVIDSARARAARPSEVPETEREPGKDDDGIDAMLLATAMAEALATLSTEHRAVLEQVYFRDQPVARAAAVLGVPEGTVKSRAYYALRALRLACEEKGIVP